MADLKPSELRELAELYRKKGDLEKERDVLLMLRGMPEIRPATGQSIPLPIDSRGMIDGEIRDATLSERFFNTALERPIDNKDIFEFSLASLGSVAAPPLAVPAALSRSGALGKMATPFIRNAPKIVGAGAGGGLATGAREAFEEDASLVDILSESGEGFKDYALAETAGVGLGSLLSAGAQRFIGPQMDDIQRSALEFAKKESAPIPLSTVKEGAGAISEKASGLTFFGNLVRRNKASKINKLIEQQSRALTPLAKPPEVIAPRAQTLLKETLSEASDAKNIAFNRLETAIGKDAIVPDSTIKQAISEALEQAKAQGKRITGPLKEMEEFMNFQGDRSFNALERFRKDTLNKVTGNYKTKEIGQPVQEALEEIYRQLGKSKGVDINASIKEANDLVKELSALKKIPGLNKFASDVRNPQGWITGFVNENNEQALKIIEKKAPDVYKSLTEQRLAMSFFNKNGEWSPAGFVKYIRDNPTFIENTFGKEQKKVLNNFAAYIEATSDFAGKQSVGDALSSFGGPAMAGLFGRDLGTVVTTEASGVVLATQLTNPNSPLFKIFSETDPIKLGKAIEEASPFITRSMVDEFERQ